MMNRVGALIPLRGGSKGIPKKNIRLFNERPLCYWALEAVMNAGLKTYVSTDSSEIASIVRELSAEITIINRPSELAGDKASTESVIEHALTFMPEKHILLAQATSPTTTQNDVENACVSYFEEGCKPLVTGTRVHRFFWADDGSPINYDPFRRPRRQDWNGTFQENGAFYIFSKEHFKSTGCRASATANLFVMDEINSIEIDSRLDWKLLENLIGNAE